MAREKTSPEQLILLNDVEMPPQMRADVLETVVGQHVEGGDAFQVQMNALDSTNQRLKWIDAPELAPGTSIEIRFGYLGELETLIQGEITALEVKYPSDGPALLLVQGFDRLHRLRGPRRTQVFTEVKDSQIAEKIATDLGLEAKVDDSEVVHAYLLQNSLTDLDFILDRARRIRFEVLVRDKTLTFRKAANDRGQVAELEYMVDLMSFSVRLSTVEQRCKVSVHGWNPETKEALLGLGQPGDESTRMDGTRIGPEIAAEAFMKTAPAMKVPTAIVDVPVFSQAEAEQIAKAKFNDMAIRLIRGEARAVGRTELRAGSTIRLGGVGKRFSGLYYVSTAEHRLGPAEGYVTRLYVERSGT